MPSPARLGTAIFSPLSTVTRKPSEIQHVSGLRSPHTLRLPICLPHKEKLVDQK